MYRQFDAPLGMVVEGVDDATIRPQGIEPGAPVDRGALLAGRHIEAGDRAVAVIPGNIARLIAPDAGLAIGRSVTMRVGGAVKLGSTRIGGSGTPRDYAIKIVGVFDEQASQTSFRIPLDDALLAGAENRGLTPDSIRETTGYSGLAYLTRFPIDKLKIDKTFVQQIASDGDAAIVVAIIALAHSLKLHVIAEGVETEAQLAQLRAEGCDEVQGYLFSRPVPVSEVADVIRRWNGTSRAVGASPRDIRALFLAEAAYVGVFGGILGLALGLAGGQLIDRIIRQLNPRTNPAAIFVVGPDLALGALALALGVALLAGFLPARRAMRMSALSALRYE